MLLVDDEPSILIYAKASFERCGYSTLVADNGKLALDILNRRGSDISLVILDVTMPGDGRRGNMSGFLQKPYTPNRLMDKVEELRNISNTLLTSPPVEDWGKLLGDPAADERYVGSSSSSFGLPVR